MFAVIHDSRGEWIGLGKRPHLIFSHAVGFPSVTKSEVGTCRWA
jgi:hypothetical protein